VTRDPRFAFWVPDGWNELAGSDLAWWEEGTGPTLATAWRHVVPGYVAVIGVVAGGVLDDAVPEGAFYRLAYDQAHILESAWARTAGPVIQSPSKLLVGGDRAISFVSETVVPAAQTGVFGRDMTTRLYNTFALRDRQLYYVLMSVIREHEDECARAYWTALGSWRWYV
jgi:hypothetical protein